MATNAPFDQPGSMLTSVIKKLQGRDLLLIYKATGLPFYWLRRLASGGYQNPSVNRIEFLLEYFKQEEAV
jgi:hypothetical protein